MKRENVKDRADSELMKGTNRTVDMRWIQRHRTWHVNAQSLELVFIPLRGLYGFRGNFGGSWDISFSLEDDVRGKSVRTTRTQVGN